MDAACSGEILKFVSTFLVSVPALPATTLREALYREVEEGVPKLLAFLDVLLGVVEVRSCHRTTIYGSGSACSPSSSVGSVPPWRIARA